MKDVATIKKSLLEAKEAYYSGEPIISDDEFDKLEDKLKLIDPNNVYFSIVGSSERGAKIQHKYLMRSMGKSNTLDHIMAWYKRCNFKDNEKILLQHKLDGLSGTLKYKGGNLQYVATRGDGKEGSDITRHASIIKSIKSSLPDTREFELRGEFITKQKSKLRDLNPNAPLRSIVAGIINRKESSDELQYVDFVTYGVEGINFDTELEKYSFLKNLKIDQVGFEFYNNIQEIHNAYQSISNIRFNLDYEIDGIILKPNDCKIQNELEDGNEHHPKWATAWKFLAEGKWTTLKEINYETSRLGKLIPVATFDPIILGGSSIKKATLNNHKMILDLDIRIGDSIFIEKANDIIPKLIEKKDGEKRVKRIDIICKCGTKSDMILDGVHITCKNPTCSERIIGQITSWIQKIGIENFSEETVKTLYSQGIVKSINDLYTLTSEKLQGIAGIGESKINNILSELERTRTMHEDELLAKLGIPLVGTKAINKLGIKTIQQFRDFKDSEYAIGRSIIEWKSDKGNLELLNILAECLNFKTKKKISTTGIKVCATGKAPIKRDELIKKLESSGKFEWIDSVSKETQLLVTDDLNGDSSKLTKAKKLKIETITYEELFERLN